MSAKPRQAGGQRRAPEWLDDYVGVHDRIEKLYERYPEARITTELVQAAEGFIAFKASIYRRALAFMGFEVHQSASGPRLVDRDSKSGAGDSGDFSEDNWRGGEAWRKKITDLEASKENKNPLRDWH
jgi:hypothetical protein